MWDGLNFATISDHLIVIGIYCVLALSLNLINGVSGMFSLGHHGFWGMGAYAAGMIVWTMGSPHGSLVIFALSFVGAMVAAALFGLLVGLPCLRLKGDYLAIATLGFAEIYIICARNSESWKWFGERGLGGAAGFSLGETFRGSTYRISSDDLSGNDPILALVGGSNDKRTVVYLILTWLIVGLVFLFIRNLIRSGHGRAIMAIRDDETAAELMGVNLIRYKVTVFVLGAAMAGLAGALLANFRSTVSPGQFPMMEGIKILLMCVLGGLGSMSGTLMAVFVLYISEQALGLFSTPVPFFVWSNGSFHQETKSLKDLWQVVFALVLILLMLLRPRGIMGRREFSRAFFADLINGWKDDPFSIISTVVQFGLLLAGLALSSENAWPLWSALILMAMLQAAKRIAARKRAAAQGLPV